MANPVHWFEIPVLDMERGKNFYSKILGVELQHDPNSDWSFMAFFPHKAEAEGSGGALICQEDCKPSADGSTVYFSVADIEATQKLIEENGGTVILPKMSIGEHGYIAQFIDSEGNRVALYSN